MTLLIVVFLGIAPTSAVAARDPAGALDRALAAAEAALRAQDAEAARRHYGAALTEGWLLLGTLDLAEEKVKEARDAFFRASASAVEGDERALRSLALAHLQLAQGLVAAGRPEQAVQELEAARAVAPGDLELAFALAGGHLRQKRPDAAARLFAEVLKGRPIPETHVLVGRTYLDFGELDRARAELRAALAMDPRARRAHYYLGMVAVTEGGVAQIDEAIAEFEAELKVAPGDPVAGLQLGMALVEARRAAQALPLLQRAAVVEPPQARALYYLGRSQLALDQPAEAVVALRRALERAQAEKADETRLGSIHNQLGQAFRALGAADDSAAHFAEAERLSGRGAEASRERLARYMSDRPEAASGPGVPAPFLVPSPLSDLPPGARVELRGRVTAALAGAYQNLGVLEARGQRFGPAADLFERAAELDAALPGVQYSLGVARFNAQQFRESVGPLSRALAAGHPGSEVRRMLALALFNSADYRKAAELLAADPESLSDPSLQFAYGVALVRSNQATEAERVFSRLLARHGDSPEVMVVLGETYVQQGDFESAIRTLQRALQLRADVPDAHGTLGVLYFKQGRLAEAEAALREELKVQPGQAKARSHLAAVLDMLGRSAEAVPLLRGALDVDPNLREARYLLGKILVAQDLAAEAVTHLEAAAALSPDDASVRFQLAQAYRKLNRPEEAARQLEMYHSLKEKRRGETP